MRYVLFNWLSPVPRRDAELDRPAPAGVRAGLIPGLARRLHWAVGMEVLIALIVLVAGVMLERSRPAADPIRVRVRRD